MTTNVRLHRRTCAFERQDVGNYDNYAYYGITSNFDRIAHFFYMAKRVWRKALARRSQQTLPWRKMQKLMERFPLPAPRIVHRYGT